MSMTRKVNIVNVDDSEYPTADREYKDWLFRLVFSNKEDLLSLYNAVSGTEYEHQSTYNPNMPMRGLLYYAKLYEKIIARNNINIYGSSAKTFPFPQHIVFYNGTDSQPDRTVLRLSDLFEKGGEGRTPAMECTTVMLNINYGHNRELMEKCRRLKEYAIFVDRVRKNLETKKSLEEAIMQTIDDCIRDEILKDILIQQKAEVVQMILETFDQEKYEKAVKNEAFEDGYQAGKEAVLLEKIKKKLARGKTAEEIAQDLEESKETIQEIIDRI